MGAYGVAVEKTITWRGQPERIANVYHYRITAPVPADYQALANAVVTEDKAAHTSDVVYNTVRVFGPTEGSAADNLMRYVADLSGPGTRVSSGGSMIYQELAAVASIYVGRSPVKNRKVFVRKFIRVLRSQTASGVDPISGLLTAAEKTFWTNWMDGLRVAASGGVNFDLVTPKDVLVPAGNSATCLNYAHIRQIRH